MPNLNPERRVEREHVLKCLHCGGAPYAIWRIQNMEPDGELRQSFQTLRWPNGTYVDPPQHPENPTCPDCREVLQRVAP